MSKIIPFSYGDNLIRVVNDEETGEPLWVAKDVCAVLEYKEVSKTVAKLDDEEKGTKKIRTLGGEQEMMCITESGLYTLILRSNKPEAKPFKRWVTHDVLPTIRKTGSYGTPNGGAFSEEIADKLIKVLEVTLKTNLAILNHLQNLSTPQEAPRKTLSAEELTQVRCAVNLACEAVKLYYDAANEHVSYSGLQKEIYAKLNLQLGVHSYIYIPSEALSEALIICKEIEVRHNRLAKERREEKQARKNMELVLPAF